MTEVFKVNNKDSVGIEPTLNYIPWVSREDISTLIDKIKEVKKDFKEILSALDDIDRKIRGVEEHKKYIEDKISSMSRDIDELRLSLRKVLPIALLSELVGAWKSVTCGWISENICSVWKLRDEVVSDIRKYFGDEALIKVGETWRLVIKKNPYICAFCPLYKPKNEVSTEHREV